MSGNAVNSCTAFLEDAIVAEGLLTDVAVALRHQFGTVNKVGYLIFDDTNGSQIDFDLRGNDEEILERVRRAFAPPAAPPEVGPDEQLGAETRTGPGRPKLGVVAREVTLLPRHWQWLGEQPGGASVALRKLVDEARKAVSAPDRKRRAQEAAYRFMSAKAGNLSDFEEASRALFKSDKITFEKLVGAWPPDICRYVLRLSNAAFEPAS